MTVLQGTVNVFLGLYPDAPITRASWSMQSPVGVTSLNIKQTDANFHIGTWYYLTIQAVNAKAQVKFQVA